jgi:hypothetical protein
MNLLISPENGGSRFFQTQKHLPVYIHGITCQATTVFSVISEVHPNNLWIYTSPRDTFISFTLIFEGVAALGKPATLVEAGS